MDRAGGGSIFLFLIRVEQRSGNPDSFLYFSLLVGIFLSAVVFGLGRG